MRFLDVLSSAQKVCWLALISGLMNASALAQTDAPKLIRLSSLEWPPYTGVLLPREGISTRVAVAAAKASGYRLLASHHEWTTTMQLGEKDPNFDGYFPEYFNADRDKACHLSGSLGTSVLGLATLKSQPLPWSNLKDLAAYKLAVVDGYSNGEAFDQLVAAKKQPVEAAASDAVNVQKLLAGKVRAIVIDKNVLTYTLNRIGGENRAIFNPRPIAELTLHICFKRTERGRQMRDEFDAGLKQVKVRELETEYMKMFGFVSAPAAAGAPGR